MQFYTQKFTTHYKNDYERWLKTGISTEDKNIETLEIKEPMSSSYYDLFPNVKKVIIYGNHIPNYTFDKVSHVEFKKSIRFVRGWIETFPNVLYINCDETIMQLISTKIMAEITAKMFIRCNIKNVQRIKGDEAFKCTFSFNGNVQITKKAEEVKHYKNKVSKVPE